MCVFFWTALLLYSMRFKHIRCFILSEKKNERKERGREKASEKKFSPFPYAIRPNGWHQMNVELYIMNDAGSYSFLEKLLQRTFCTYIKCHEYSTICHSNAKANGTFTNNEVKSNAKAYHLKIKTYL